MTAFADGSGHANTGGGQQDADDTDREQDDGYGHRHKRHKTCKKVEFAWYDQWIYHGFIVWHRRRPEMHPQPDQDSLEAKIRSQDYALNRLQSQVELLQLMADAMLRRREDTTNDTL